MTIACLAVQPAIASPIRLSHQGRLFEASGDPIEGEHAIGVRLVAEDGTVLWSDTFITTLNGGYYHLMIGDQAPLDDGLFRGAAPQVQLTVDDGEPLLAAGPIAHVPYAAVAEWARTAQDVRGGVVDATEIRLDGRTVLQAGSTTHLARVRAEDGLQLGAASTAACDATTRGLLRYPAGGPLEVCDTTGWAEVGAAGGASTCSIVGECPDGGEPSRVFIGDLEIYTPEGAQAFCSRYDKVHGALGVGAGAAVPATVDLSCLSGVVNRVGNELMFAGSELWLDALEGIDRNATFYGRVHLDALRVVGMDLRLTGASADAPLPALTTVGGDLGWGWASGTDASLTLPDFMPALETVGGHLGTSGAGPLVPLPSLISVAGNVGSNNVSTPNLRTIGGLLTVGPRPAAPFPALEEVGGLLIGSPFNRNLGAPPIALDSFTSLRRINGNLTIACIQGWELPELNAFVDRIGRANITGTVTLQAASYCASLP